VNLDTVRRPGHEPGLFAVADGRCKARVATPSLSSWCHWLICRSFLG
jgi:hypothetical protein